MILEKVSLVLTFGLVPGLTMVLGGTGLVVAVMMGLVPGVTIALGSAGEVAFVGEVIG